MILDVGCGDTYVGDVNTDLFIRDVEGHRIEASRFNLDVHKIPNFIVCDASHLPFKSNCFEMVVSRQVIEHVAKPFLMFQEMFRCSKNLIVVETVHRRGERLQCRKARAWSRKHHVNSFNFSSFKKLAASYKIPFVKFTVLSSRKMPSKRLPLLTVPFEFRAVFAKRGYKKNSKVEFLKSL